jgi:hypothetical protein
MVPGVTLMMRLVASQAHRWKSVFFDLPRSHEYWAFWDAVKGAKGNMGRLHQLTIDPDPVPSLQLGLRPQLSVPGIFTGARITSLTINRLIPGKSLLIDGGSPIFLIS